MGSEWNVMELEWNENGIGMEYEQEWNGIGIGGNRNGIEIELEQKWDWNLKSEWN